MKKILATLLLTLSGNIVKADMPAVHGMVLFGEKSTYLSHLPMFHAPHDYQVIVKVQLPSAQASKAVERYQAAKAKGQVLFTFVPQKMDLTQLSDGTIKEINGKIYSGHFEQGGTPLGNAKLQIQKIIFSKKLDPTESEENKYLFFGEDGDYYGVHLINGKPGFDSILALGAINQDHFISCRTRICGEANSTPLSDVTLPVTVENSYADDGNANSTPAIDSTIGEYFGITAKVTKVIYFNTDDLKD